MKNYRHPKHAVHTQTQAMDAGSSGGPVAGEGEDSPQGPLPRGSAGALSASGAAGEPPLPQGAPGALAEPCASCGEKCCNRFAVPVTGFDLVRIADRLGDEPWEFAELAPAAEIQAAPHWLVFIFDEKGQMREKLLTLQRRRNNYCIFSRHSQGCAIWGFHPMVCRAYPFAFTGGERIGYTKNFVCPRPWEQKEWPANVRQILEVQNLEMEEYNKIVREWNAAHSRQQMKRGTEGGEKAFWKFLMEKSREKMKEWKTDGAGEVEKMGSNGPKRGFMEPEWNPG